jgi:hypothetical protein
MSALVPGKNFPFRGRVDSAAPESPSFFLAAVKNYPTFDNTSVNQKSNVNMIFIMSQSTESTSGVIPAVLYPTYNAETGFVNNPSGTETGYEPIPFSAKLSLDDGFILTSTEVKSTVGGNQYLVPAANITTNLPQYESVSENASVENTFRMKFTPDPSAGIRVNNNFLFAGLPYIITNASNNVTTWNYFDPIQNAKTETGVLIPNTAVDTNNYYFATSYGEQTKDTNFTFFLIPVVHTAIMGSKTACFSPNASTIYYDAAQLSNNITPDIQITDPTGFDAAYLYVKWGHLVLGKDATSETDYDFDCPTGWTDLLGSWTSPTMSLSTTNPGNACGFSTGNECIGDYWYNYCSTGNVCGDNGCRGVCVNTNRICTFDPLIEQPNEPFTCGEEPVPPKPSSYTWIIVVSLIFGLLIIGLIIFFIWRSNRSPDYSQVTYGEVSYSYPDRYSERYSERYSDRYPERY